MFDCLTDDFSPPFASVRVALRPPPRRLGETTASFVPAVRVFPSNFKNQLSILFRQIFKSLGVTIEIIHKQSD